MLWKPTVSGSVILKGTSLFFSEVLLRCFRVGVLEHTCSWKCDLNRYCLAFGTALYVGERFENVFLQGSFVLCV